MDSLYYSAPRPYNKYPRGYRPVQDTNSINSDLLSRRLRPSSSWSSFPQETSDQRSKTLSYFPQSACVSPDHTNNNTFHWQDVQRSRQPFRTESSSTLFDNYNTTYLSPRELSPFSTSSEYCNNTNSIHNINKSINSGGSMIGSNLQSPVAHEYPRCYDNVPRPTHTTYEQRENDFLRNLQRQKEETYNTPRQEMSASWYGQPHVPLHQPHQQQQPRRLAKTQSETGFDSFAYNPSSNPNIDSMNVSTANNRLSGFFQNRVIEPSWMTDPPPPKSFQENYIIRNNQNNNPNSHSNSERFRHDPTYREPSSVTIHHQEPVNFRSYHRDDYFAQPSENAYRQQVRREPSPVRPYQFSPQTIPNPVFEREQTNVYQNIPQSSQLHNDRHSNRNSAVYPSDPIPLSHNRVLHIHPVANHESQSHQISNPVYQHNTNTYPMQSQRARIQSPLRDFARLTSPNRETIVDIQQNHHYPDTRKQETDDRVFSPVESKVYNRLGPTVINGFTSNRHTYNSHTDNHDARNRRDSSQPPVAVIEPNINVNMPQDPIPYNKPHLGHGHGHGQTRKNEPVRYSRQELSPMSNYENEDSDLDIEEMARKALPKYLQNTPKSNYFRDNLQGILIKNPSLHRTSSKKVVFIDQEKASQSKQVPNDIQMYDAAIGELVESWAQLSDKIGGDVATAKVKVLKIFEQFRNFLWSAAGTAKPSDDVVQKMVSQIGESMQDITAFKDSKRNTPQFNHLSAIAETIPAFSWVMSKLPAPLIKEHIDAAMFFGNRILKEFKETDPTQVEWFKSWKSIFEEMQKFVRQTHTTGLVWNSSPGSEPPATSSAAAPAPPKGPGGPPPPPPPPIPADLFANMPPAPSNTDKSNRDALFASLNKGEAITSGLKKVTADMQTHKNPNLRGNAPTPDKVSKAAAGSTPAKPAQPVRKPPSKTCDDGKTWKIDYFVNDPNIVIDITDKKQCIYVFKCENSVIKVNGKANSITLDGCKKTSIVFQAVVGQCETINCQSVQIQTLGELPTLSIQKTDGCQVYLSKEAQGCEIVTSKSSEMNILLQTTDDGDYSEFPVPEQFKTTFVNGKLVTTASEII